MPKPDKGEAIIRLRSDLDEETSKKLRIIKEWLGVSYNTEAVKFCIHQTYRALKEGKLIVLKD